jgi:hypothetical protein
MVMQILWATRTPPKQLKLADIFKFHNVKADAISREVYVSAWDGKE